MNQMIWIVGLREPESPRTTWKKVYVKAKDIRSAIDKAEKSENGVGRIKLIACSVDETDIAYIK